MAEKPATPGTGFHAPLYLLDDDLNVVGTWGSGDVTSDSVATALTNLTVDATSATTLKAAVDAIVIALGGSVAP